MTFRGVNSMSYNLRILFENLEIQLSVNPRCSICDLEHALTISRHTLEKSVRFCRRMSFREYRQRKVLENAIALLNSKLMSRKEVAFRLGYKSPAAFSRFVKSRTGRTPSQIMNGAL